MRQFSSQLQGYGFVAAQGGTAAPRPDDSQLKPGDMAGMVLVQGDASINSACTVTAVQADRVFLCGHPFLSLGDVQLPMARSRVLTTLSSDLASTKIVNVGGSIGTITGDHLTAVTGKLGAPPAMIPLELTLSAAGSQKQLHFELVNHPRLTPILVALTTFNGLTQNSLYGEGTTLHLSGEIQMKDHAPVKIENTFAPGDALTPDSLPIALTMQSIFSRLFTNSFEPAGIERVSLRVESVPGRHSFTIESAWLKRAKPHREKRCESACCCVPTAALRKYRKLPCACRTRSRAAPCCAYSSATPTCLIALREVSPSPGPPDPPPAWINS